MKTIFCDIDGTISVQSNDNETNLIRPLILLPGVKEKFWEWENKGYTIIITTARRESTRSRTIQQLQDAGLMWDQLIMGLPPGERIVINDRAYSGLERAIAIPLEKNTGMEDINI